MVKTLNISEIEKKFKEQIRLKGYSDQTLYSYWWHCEMFFKFILPKFAYNASSQDVNDYLVHISCKSDSFRNQAINGIKFCFDYVFHRKVKAYLVIRPKKHKTEPIILSEQETQKMFDVCCNLKHKSILTLAYGSGLRVSEIVNLKIKDIDSSAMVIWIREAKGRKDRKAILTQSMLELLRRYYKEYMPKEWLFNGQDGISQYTTRSIQEVVKQVSAKANIKKRVYPHLLRHGYCTGILDNGGDIHDVATTAGHSSLKTSMGYIHASTKYISNINSPINNIHL